MRERPKIKVRKPTPEKPPRPTPKAQTISPAVCAQIALGISIYGREGVKAQARKRGYSNSQIAAAQRACGY